MKWKEVRKRIDKMESKKDGWRIEFVNDSGQVIHAIGPSREKAEHVIQFDEDDYGL